jgi:AcrR family transcriptional regulator
VKAKPNIREAQKALTRQRILDAARELFYRQGYYGTSVDQIALEAGASRPTFYLHFRDKEEVLTQIAEDYAVAVEACADSLPGPQPSREEVRAWVAGLVGFLDREKLSFSVVSEVSSQEFINPIYGRRILEAWTHGLARRAPAFATAMSKDKRGTEARAAAELIVLEITWAAANAWLNKNTAFGQAAVDLVAQRLFDFLSDPRYADAKLVLRSAGGRAQP